MSELVHHFDTLGYVHRKALFTPAEMSRLSDAFERAMAVARGPDAETPPRRWPVMSVSAASVALRD